MLKLNQNLSQKQVQRLELRPQMLQSLHLLSLPVMELEVHLKEELISNPMLDMNESSESENNDSSNDSSNEESNETEAEESFEDELQKTIEEANELSEILDQWNDFHSDSGYGAGSDEDKPNPEQYLKAAEDFKEEFTEQLREFDLSDNEYEYASELIDSCNAHGFLNNPDEILNIAAEYEIPEERAEEIHQIIMHLQPQGITARNIEECLLSQLSEQQLKDQLLVNVISFELNSLLHRKYNQLASKYNCSFNEILACKDIISKLDPKPGMRLVQSEISYIVPDIIIKRIDKEYELIINDSSTPNIRINRNYNKIIKSLNKDKNAIGYVRNKINSAKFLIRALFMRNRTLERVTRAIINHQKDFFYNETGILEPMTYAVIAEELQVNESTISRVVRTKYADTPFGLMCLKEFFTSSAGKDKNYDAVSRQMVEKNIRELVENEDRKKPISDQNIANVLKERGISVSRRVIAKYREEMGILNSRLRRKM